MAYIRDKYPRPNSGSTASQPAAGPSKLTPTVKTGAAKKPATPTTKLTASNMVSQLREAAAGKASGQKLTSVSPTNSNLTALTKAFNAAKKKSGASTAKAVSKRYTSTQNNASAVNALKETLQNTKKKNLNP